MANSASIPSEGSMSKEEDAVLLTTSEVEGVVDSEKADPRPEDDEYSEGGFFGLGGAPSTEDDEDDAPTATPPPL
jgi:hypothetical protein